MAKKCKKTFALVMVMCMLTSMLPVQALADETETAAPVIVETQVLEGLDVNTTVEGSTIVVEFAPAEDTPAVEEPAGEEPAGEEPAGEEPAGEEPAGEEPAGEEPAGEEPAGEEPAGEEPAGEEPAGEEPAGETSVPAESSEPIVVEPPQGSVEWESNLTLNENVDIEVTDITVTNETIVEEQEDVAEDVPAENEEPAEEATEEAPVEEPAEEVTEEAPAEEPAEEVTEEAPAEEPAEEVTEEAPAEEPAEEVTEEAPVEADADEVEGEETTTEPTVETTVETTTETTTETIVESENGEDASDEDGESEEEATPEKTTTEIVTESVTVETESKDEDGAVITGQETVTETTTTVTDTFVETTTDTTTETTTETVVDEEGNEIVTETVTETVTESETEITKESVTVEVVVEGSETITNPVEEIAPGEEVPSVTVPVPDAEDINVEENVEGEVVETENEDGSTITTQTNQTVTENVDETTGAVTTTETITTTENVKSPEKEQIEDGDVITETTTTTTIEKTTEESAEGEVIGEKVQVTVTVIEDVSEILGDIKEGEDDQTYDYTVTTETTEREVELEITNNGVKVEDVASGLVGEQEVELKGLTPVYDETDNYVDAKNDGKADDKLNGEHVGKEDVFDRNYLSSQTLDKVVLENGVVIWVNDSDQKITNITVPEGTELPEDFEYSVGSSVKEWYTKVDTNPYKERLPENATLKNNAKDTETQKKYDKVTLENGIVLFLDDTSKTVAKVVLPEGVELPEDFEYGVGTDVKTWYTATKVTSSDTYQNVLPAESTKKDNVAINNIDNWYDSEGNLIHAPAEGGEFCYVGTGEHSKFFTARVYVTYKKDAEGNTIYEDGEPVIESIKTAQNGDDVTIDGELATELPDGVSLEPIYDNYGGSRPTTFMLMDQNGNRVYAYCCDMETGTSKGHWYSVSNLEDSNYYASEESENHIRSIALNGYWGTSDMPKEDGSYETGSLEGIKKNLRDAINNGEMENEVIQMPAVDENGDAVLDEAGNPVMESRTMLELIDEMTEGEALLATQAAIWSYSNGSFNVQNGKDGLVLIDPDHYKSNHDPSSKSKDGEALDDYGSARVDFLYKWLLNLDTEEESTVVINEKNFVDDVSLTVHEKVEDETIAENYDDDDTNDVYTTDLNFRLAFIPGENDDLLVQITYTDLDGQPINVIRRLAGENSEGQTYEDILPEEDGSYMLKGLKLSENKEFDFDLRLEGTQYLEQGVYVYAPVGGREMSQTFVGVAEGERNVDVSASMTISFEVDEQKQVVAHREWSSVSDPVDPDTSVTRTTTTKTTTTKTTTTTTTPPTVGGEEEPSVEEIPEEEVPQEELPVEEEVEEDYDPTPVVYRMTRGVGQLETIIDEEVPLAEVPQTGDNSIIWFALILMSVCGLCLMNLSEKKKKA